MKKPTKCPRNNFQPCIGEECGWWVSLRGTDGQVFGRCSILQIAYSLDTAANAMKNDLELMADQISAELH